MRTTALLALAPMLLATRASAEPLAADSELVLRTERGSWDDAVRYLQATPGTDARTVHVKVQRAGSTLPCRDVELELEGQGASAFAIEPCDTGRDETTLRLLHREELFDRNSFVPVPRPIELHATVHRHLVVRGGGQVPLGGSDLRCGGVVHPYVVNLLDGERTELPPGRFELRPLTSGVVVTSDGTGYRLQASDSSTQSVRYDVIDSTTHVVLVSGQATLSCRSDTAVPAAEPPEPAPQPFFRKCTPSKARCIGFIVAGSVIGAAGLATEAASLVVDKPVGVGFGIALAVGSVVPLAFGLSMLPDRRRHRARFEVLPGVQPVAVTRPLTAGPNEARALVPGDPAGLTYRVHF
jgi:hypothetical protein